MKNAMKAMDSLLDSDFVDEYFSDEEKLEKSRQQMLANIDKYLIITNYYLLLLLLLLGMTK